jgi:hypothetical protein
MFLAASVECRAVFTRLTRASNFVTKLTFCGFLRLIQSKFRAREARLRPRNEHQRSIFRTLRFEWNQSLAASVLKGQAMRGPRDGSRR